MKSFRITRNTVNDGIVAMFLIVKAYGEMRW